MAKTKKQGENSACSALFEHAYYSSGYGILVSSKVSRNRNFTIIKPLFDNPIISVMQLEDRRRNFLLYYNFKIVS